MLNPRGGHATAWALMFVFSFPLLTGFLNYILATGLSLSALPPRSGSKTSRRSAPRC
jgi:hypothetical protein